MLSQPLRLYLDELSEHFNVAIKRNNDAQVEFCCKQVPSKAPALTPSPPPVRTRMGPKFVVLFSHKRRTGGTSADGHLRQCVVREKKLAVKVNVATTRLHVRFLYCVSFWKKYLQVRLLIDVYGNSDLSTSNTQFGSTFQGL